jgi:Ca-activated chloride channel family protein
LDALYRPENQRESHAALVALAGVAISRNGANSTSATGPASQASGFRILASASNEALEPVVKRVADREHVSVQVTYAGTVDLMQQLGAADLPYDAVWPESSLWLALGDTKKQVSNPQSTMRAPVVLGVKRSVAQKLGWVGADVRVADILAAAESGKLRFMMASASQSNSGASAYMGYLYAFAGNPDVLTSDNLRDPAVGEKVTRILGKVNRSSGSSTALRALFLENYADYDAMVNYEAEVIAANRDLLRTNREPLYAVYPVDGLTIADFPLGYVSHGDATKEAFFGRLQEDLLYGQGQQEIARLGFRTGLIGSNPEEVDRAVFNPDWGIDTARVLTPVRYPRAPVIREALDLYQTAFRKGSFTVYALDFSGSMAGKGEQELKEAMRTLLDQDRARQNLLQASPNDVTVVILFSNAILAEWSVTGNDPAQLNGLLQNVVQRAPGGGTDIYTPVVRANQIIQSQGAGDRFPAIILMTDGQSNAGSFGQVKDAGLKNVPVYAILFGDASETQLKEISGYTSGKIFDGRKSLVEAFRTAKGYN